MPQLPSGLHFALDTSPLEDIVDDAYDGRAVHVLMAITEPQHMFEHVRILYFRPRTPEAMQIQNSPRSGALPAGLEPYPSGFNLLSIYEEQKRWSQADQDAFVEFLNAPVTEAYFRDALDIIRSHQQKLLGHPSTLPGMIATWWKLGCHPLQEPLDGPGPKKA